MDSTRARHHWGTNLARYHYLEKRYGRKARAKTVWTLVTLIVLFLGSIVAIQLGETDAQRKARINEEEAFFVDVACKLGERACAAAKADSQRVRCRLFPEDCYSAK